MVSTCWPTLRTSCATTAKPAPCAPARELSISAFSASIFIWLVIFWIDLGLLAGDLVDLGGQSGDQRGNVGFILGACRIGGLFCDRCGLESEARRTLAEIPQSLCGCRSSADRRDSTRACLDPLSGIMANDWFNFRRPAGSITGTSCIFFVQVAFVGIGSKLTWPRLCQPRPQRSRDAAAPRHRPGFAFAAGAALPYFSKAS